MRTLISWYATKHDFLAETGLSSRVNEEGPTMQFHEHFFTGYDRHVVLSSAASEQKDLPLTYLLNALRQRFPTRRVETRFLGIIDVIDMAEIKSKVERTLLELRDDDLGLFISPGTPAMQVAWYFCHMGLGLRTRLLQTRAARFSKDRQPQLVEVNLMQSSVPVSAVLSETLIDAAVKSETYLITESIRPVYERARLAARAERVTCLIRGEHGTGKEHLAQYLHEQSARRERPFVPVNCSALSDELLESRLFGHKKGAFTGADRDTKGFFEVAHGGTIFLDEIGDVSPKLQQSLLRVLQSGEVLPVGATKPLKVDVRVVAATNRHLEAMAHEGAFRWDLYYRMAVVELTLPPLRDRSEAERRELIRFFLKQLRQEFKRPSVLRFTPDALAAMVRYPFPGNVRELVNLIRQCYVFCDREVGLAELPAKILESPEAASVPNSLSFSSLNWREMEQRLIKEALSRFSFNQRKACTALGYGSINTLKKKLREYGISSTSVS